MPLTRPPAIWVANADVDLSDIYSESGGREYPPAGRYLASPKLRAGTAGRPLLTACLLALCICTTAVRSASAGTPYVDGISDQSLPHWNGAADDEASFKSSYFANLFYTSWMGGNPASHIKLARYAVRWNVMSDPSGEPYRTFAAWYRDAGHVLGLTLDVAIYNPEGPLPSAAEYRTQVEKLLHAFPVPYVEAWNEPNDEGVTPSAAASYWRQAHAVCAERGCTAIAGDLLDERYPEGTGVNDSNPERLDQVRYEEAYEAALEGVSPEDWGFHPYAAIKYRTKAPVEAFKEHLPRAGDHIWFTEAGAYACQMGVGESSEESQREGAEYLANTLIPAFAPTHAFYYGFMYAWNEETPCAKDSNTSLYDYRNQPRPAASVIYGGTIPAPLPSYRADQTFSASPGELGVFFLGQSDSAWKLTPFGVGAP